MNTIIETLRNLTLTQGVFLLFGALALAGSLLVVLARNIFHAALGLVLAFLGVAGIYILLSFPFIAALQLFIYIGGVAVLIAIAIVVTERAMIPVERTSNEPVMAAVLSLAAFVALIAMIFQPFLPADQRLNWPAGPLVEEAPDQLLRLGQGLVDAHGFALPFEFVSLVLVVVLIGSLYLAKERS